MTALHLLTATGFSAFAAGIAFLVLCYGAFAPTLLARGAGGTAFHLGEAAGSAAWYGGWLYVAGYCLAAQAGQDVAGDPTFVAGLVGPLLLVVLLTRREEVLERRRFVLANYTATLAEIARDPDLARRTARMERVFGRAAAEAATPQAVHA